MTVKKGDPITASSYNALQTKVFGDAWAQGQRAFADDNSVATGLPRSHTPPRVQCLNTSGEVIPPYSIFPLDVSSAVTPGDALEQPIYSVRQYETDDPIVYFTNEEIPIPIGHKFIGRIISEEAPVQLAVTGTISVGDPAGPVDAQWSVGSGTGLLAITPAVGGRQWFVASVNAPESINDRICVGYQRYTGNGTADTAGQTTILINTAATGGKGVQPFEGGYGKLKDPTDLQENDLLLTELLFFYGEQNPIPGETSRTIRFEFRDSGGANIGFNFGTRYANLLPAEGFPGSSVSIPVGYHHGFFASLGFWTNLEDCLATWKVSGNPAVGTPSHGFHTQTFVYRHPASP